MNAMFDRARTSTNIMIGLVGAVPSDMGSHVNSRTNCWVVGEKALNGDLSG